MRKTDNGQLLAELQGTLLSLELKQSEMISKYAPTYPPVQEVEKQIGQTHDAIAKAQQSPVQDVTTDRVPAQEWIATETAKAKADNAELEAKATAKERVMRSYQESEQLLNRNSANRTIWSEM